MLTVATPLVSAASRAVNVKLSLPLKAPAGLFAVGC
jgi:hypothetical protein